MARESVMSDREILQAALVGLESQRGRIDDAVRNIQSLLGVRGASRPAASTDGAQPAPTKRRMGAAARRRISIAQKQRWAASRAQTTEAEKPIEKPKRKLSKAGRAAIIAATKKRWAAVHKAEKAAAKKTTPKRTGKKAAPKGLKARVLASVTPVLAPVMP